MWDVKQPLGEENRCLSYAGRCTGNAKDKIIIFIGYGSTSVHARAFENHRKLNCRQFNSDAVFPEEP